MAGNKKHAQIFLSYHSSTVELAAHLAKYLGRRGLTSWYARDSIHTGVQWDEAICEAIKNCKAVVLLFCAQADASIHVKRELALADKYKKPVFWLRVERVEPNNLSYYLTSTQWLDWLDTRDATLEKLISDIRLLDADGFTKEKIERSENAETPAQSLNNWAKGILAFKDEREAAECAARVYFDAAHAHPDSSVILPTGRSATAIFRAMLRIANEYEGCPFGEAQIISDTETFGVWSEHETSRTRHIYETLIEPLERQGKQPDKGQINLLSGIYTDSDPLKKAQKLIRSYPPSVHGVSLSPIGEVLAYEVGTYNEIDDIISDAPRIVEVGENSKKYIDPNQPSKSIITVGMGTALSAGILLILAFDIQKANILSRLFNGPITAGIPATLLQRHGNAYVFTTESVVREARLTEVSVIGKNAREAAEWIAEK